MTAPWSPLPAGPWAERLSTPPSSPVPEAQSFSAAPEAGQAEALSSSCHSEPSALNHHHQQSKQDLVSEQGIERTGSIFFLQTGGFLEFSCHLGWRGDFENVDQALTEQQDGKSLNPWHHCGRTCPGPHISRQFYASRNKLQICLSLLSQGFSVTCIQTLSWLMSTAVPKVWLDNWISPK